MENSKREVKFNTKIKRQIDRRNHKTKSVICGVILLGEYPQAKNDGNS
jgi:hypothetical protein